MPLRTYRSDQQPETPKRDVRTPAFMLAFIVTAAVAFALNPFALMLTFVVGAAMAAFWLFS